MTELKEMLNPAQLVKHYEVLQFLIKHANRSYTFAQLDYYLPHGASVQRFPDEWLDFLREGGCANRNIELMDNDEEDEHGSSREENVDDDDAGKTGAQGEARARAHGRVSHSQESTQVDNSSSISNRSAGGANHLSNVLQRLRQRRAVMRLICRQPEVRDLDVLATLLQSPSTVLDAEGCVALHSDQIQLPLRLLQEAQRRHMVYYFPDKYDASELLHRGGGGGGALGSSSALSKSSSGGDGGGVWTTGTSQQSAQRGADSAAGGGGSALPEEHESGHSVEQMWSLTSGDFVAGALLPHTFLHMPAGVSLRYKLLTRRGVVVQDELSFPTQLWCGERLVVVMDNINAMRAAGVGAAAQRLTFAYEFRGLKSAADENAVAPLRIRSRSSALPLASSTQEKSSTMSTQPTRTLIEGGTTQHSVPPAHEHSSPNDAPSPACDEARKTAQPPPLRSATQIRVEMEAVRSCGNFVLLLLIGGVSTAVTMQVSDVESTQPGVLIAREAEPSGMHVPAGYYLMDPIVFPRATANDTQSTTQPIESATRTAHRHHHHTPLLPSWWQTSSPLVALVRSASYPAEEQVNRATSAIFTARTLQHEAALRQARVEVQQRRRRQAEEREDGGQRRRRRRARSSRFDLRNKHMIHLGLDASVPFVQPGVGEACATSSEATTPQSTCC